MVEVNDNFLQQARTYLGTQSCKVERFIHCGLQDFTPEPGRYDVIWCQWVLGHLTDEDFLAFFRRCKLGLAQNGIIVVKENVAPSNRDFDEKDSSYTRSRDVLVDLFQKAELNIVYEEKQKNFPKEIYDVPMFALE